MKLPSRKRLIRILNGEEDEEWAFEEEEMVTWHGVSSKPDSRIAAVINFTFVHTETGERIALRPGPGRARCIELRAGWFFVEVA